MLDFIKLLLPLLPLLPRIHHAAYRPFLCSLSNFYRAPDDFTSRLYDRDP